jgi:hypothetical protein
MATEVQKAVDDAEWVVERDQASPTSWWEFQMTAT